MARRPQVPANQGGTTKPPQSSHPENGLKEALDQKIGPLVPQGQRGEIVTRVYSMLVSERFSGPMPHPRHLRDYEDILPGAAERILAMAENSLAHNARMETTIIQGEIDDRKRGMRYGLGALVLSMVFGAGFGYLDKIEIALAFLGTAVLGAVVAFIKGREPK